jgi:hypothetical protein
MGVKVTNNAFGTISAGINNSVTTIVLDSGQGARFPTLGSGDYFFATLIDTSNNLEIVKVTARSSDSMTVVRAQDNSTARAFSIGDRFELRPTAALFEAIQDEASIAGISSSADATAITIDSSERVGIGTGSPTRQVMISRSIADGSGELGIVSSDSSTSGALGNIHFGNSTDTSLASIRATADGATDAGKLEFNTEKTGAAIEVAMKIDSNGNVTKPLHPVFKVGLSGTASTNASANTDIVWNESSGSYAFLNGGVTLNTSNGRVTVPVAGKYWVSVKLRSEGTVFGYTDLNIKVNGSTLARIYHNQNPGYSQYQEANIVTVIVDLAANDYLTCGLHTGNTASLSATNNTTCWFNGFLIG